MSYAVPYADPEKARQYAREWRRQYLDSHPEKRAEARARSAAYYRANKERLADYQREWAESHHERVLALASARYRRRDVRKRFADRANRKTRSYGRPDEVLNFEDLPLGPWFCFYCGTPCESWDHVDQLALGGANSVVNLVSSCLPCNQARPKSHRPVAKTVCRRGHPWTTRTTRVIATGRRCRTCENEGQRRRRQNAIVAGETAA